jgi:hypothetical protein
LVSILFLACAYLAVVKLCNKDFSLIIVVVVIVGGLVTTTTTTTVNLLSLPT